MSLRIATEAVASLVESAALAACITTVAGEGRIGEAVNTPSGEMVPSAALPPGIPETLQMTAVLDVFDTVAANATEFPNNTDALDGATLTEIGVWPGGAGGAGGGGEVVAPAHPARSAQRAVVTQIGAWP